jgi:hypothetical protein
VIVRKASAERHADVKAIIASGKEFVSASGLLGGLHCDPEEVRRTLMVLLRNPDMSLLVADIDGYIAGGLGIYCAPWQWNLEILFCEEVFWWVRPDAPSRTAHKLFHAALAVVDEKRGEGVARVSFSCLETSPSGVARLYERNGLKKTMTTHMMTRGGDSWVQ